jgi:short subunit dehydrogenase-like uncharacterized protein
MATTKKQPAKKTAPAKPAAAPKAKPAKATAPKEPPAKPAAPAKKLSQIEAAVELLKTAAEPMTCKQMVEAMLEKKLWASPGGKTPDATLYAAILREIAAKGPDARFVKAAPGRFAAKA